MYRLLDVMESKFRALLESADLKYTATLEALNKAATMEKQSIVAIKDAEIHQLKEQFRMEKQSIVAIKDAEIHQLKEQFRMEKAKAMEEAAAKRQAELMNMDAGPLTHEMRKTMDEFNQCNKRKFEGLKEHHIKQMRDLEIK